MVHALNGGLWLHQFNLRNERWAHLVSADRDVLLFAGEALDLPERWLQYRPIKHPETGRRERAWHWDLTGDRLALAIHMADSREER